MIKHLTQKIHREPSEENKENYGQKRNRLKQAVKQAHKESSRQ